MKIRQLQTSLAAHLVGDAYLADVPMVLSTNGDVLNDIDRAVAETKGICILIRQVSGDLQHVAGHVNMDGSPMIHVIEKPTINRGTGGLNKPCEDVVEKICLRLSAESDPLPPCYSKTFKLVEDADDSLQYHIWTTKKATRLTGAE